MILNRPERLLPLLALVVSGYLLFSLARMGSKVQFSRGNRRMMLCCFFQMILAISALLPPLFCSMIVKNNGYSFLDYKNLSVLAMGILAGRHSVWLPQLLSKRRSVPGARGGSPFARSTSAGRVSVFASRPRRGFTLLGLFHLCFVKIVLQTKEKPHPPNRGWGLLFCFLLYFWFSLCFTAAPIKLLNSGCGRLGRV